VPSDDHVDTAAAMSTRARIYLDWNASAPLADPARAAMVEAMADLGNPSSIHAEGRRARDRVERARGEVAALVGRPRDQVVFTSGGTEANALGVMALARVAEARGLPKVIATTKLEHPSLVGPIAELARRGWEVRAVGEPASVAALAAVNHELGTIVDIPDAPLVHVDAVQAAGKLALGALRADSLAVSAHKIGGPQGVGALAISVEDGLPLIDGGHHERGRRPGTENVVGIVGFGAACSALQLGAWPHVAAIGAFFEAGLVGLGARVHGADRPRAGGTINVAWAGARGESIVIALDLEGIACSTGAACTSGSVQPSPVLLALGHSPERAREAVRFSLGRTTTEAEIDRVLAVLPAIVERARRYG
jgi:cysteine desulfurase